MKMAKWWQWVCIGLLAVACSVMATGCSGDDDDGDAGGTTVVTNIVNGTTVVVTNTPADAEEDGSAEGESTTPPSGPTEQVLLDIGQGVEGGEGFGTLTAATPGPGSVYVTFTWTAVDVMTEPQDVTIPLRLRVDGISNDSASSPITIAEGGLAAGHQVDIRVNNDDADTTIATVYIRAVWRAD